MPISVLVLSVPSVMSNVKFEMSNVKFEMSNVISYQMSNVMECHGMSWHVNVKCQISNVMACHGISWHVKCQVPNQEIL